ncbi:MAG: M23 family metallopeptidase [Bacteroidales bacterium]|nr:M23 family metallopeptidase [Bacteroidales bacterium]
MAKRRRNIFKALHPKQIKKWGRKLVDLKDDIKDVIKTKHRFVIMDSETFREKFSFQLSGINVFVTVGVIAIVTVTLTAILIAFTPLREFIPGHANSRMVEQTYKNAYVIDSLEQQLANQERMVHTIQCILQGKDPSEGDDSGEAERPAKVDSVNYTHSKADGELRREIESADNKYQVRGQKTDNQTKANSFGGDVPMNSQLYFTPMKGKIIASYDPKIKHYGVDIAGTTNATIKAAYSGTVAFSGFTVETGYVIVLQHPGNVISLYKHNSALLKREGDFVRAGEPIAYLGNSGELTTGPHLHFELWINGKAVNPLQYISF